MKQPDPDARDCGSENPLVAGLARAAVKHRVDKLGNRVNELVLKILWPNDWQAQQDAYDALFWCCHKALGPLFYREMRSPLIPLISDIDYGTSVFISTALEKFISEHKKLSPEEIAALALKKHLGFIAKAVRCKLIDHLRHVYSRDRRIATKDAGRIDALADAAILRATVKGLSKRLAGELGDGPFETLRVLVEGYPLGKTKREWKGNSTRTIARAFHISLKQARKKKRALLDAAESSGSLIQMLVRQALNDTAPEKKVKIEEQYETKYAV
jgi:hypothetical protein